VIGGLFWSFGATLCGAIGSLVVTPVVLEALGASQFGLYVLVLSMTAYAGFFDFGMSWAAGRFFAEDYAAGDATRMVERFRTLSSFLSAIGLGSFVLALGIGPAVFRASGVPEGTPVVLPLFLAAVSFALSLNVGLCAALLRACQRFEAAGQVATLGALLLPLGSYVIARGGGGLCALLAVNALVNAAGVLTAFVLARGFLRPVAPVVWWRTTYLREMAAFGGWTSISRFCMLIALQVDRLVVALVGSVAGLTYYAVPTGLAGRMNVLGGPLASLFFSRASLLDAQAANEDLARQHGMAARLLALAACAAAVPLLSIGGEFLRAWVGEEMAIQGGPVLVVMTLGYAVAAASSVDAVIPGGCGRADLSAKARLFWLLPAGLIVALVVPLSPVLGVAGGVGTWLAGVGLTDMVMARYIVRSRNGGVVNGFPFAGVVLCVGCGWLVSAAMRPLAEGLVAAILVLLVVAVATAAPGLLAILALEDRQLLVERIRALAGALSSSAGALAGQLIASVRR